ncbi:iron permease FTR1 family-domain-containing protein [Catenaria anguillulae PL171]|uniref:Iron permease FTR1 family-domain-containing protein n=1 Tax=Catenaria anguillulae PL171 TaxID=765915 RepID=A0A1Y2HNZ9_9FUNG|nr:iron permease FTR1 family-domain-containing protein [Catenaria anguillulae PL171]
MSDSGITRTFGVPDPEVSTKFRSQGWFDVPAYFVFTREVIEMSVIIAVLITFLHRCLANDVDMRKRMIRQVYLGSLAALAICIGIAILFIVLFQAFRIDVWGTETFEIVFEAIMMLLATAVVTAMVFTFLKVEFWQLKWERKLATAANEALESMNRNSWTMAALPFTIVMREGLETLVLLGGTSASSSAKSIILPAITGTATGLLIGWLAFKGGKMIVLKRYIQISTVFLLFVAAGLFMRGCHEIEELTGGEIILWEIEDPTFSHDDGNLFFQVIGSLFGWRNEATLVTTISYFAYWVVTLPALWWYNKRQQRNALAFAEKHGMAVAGSASAANSTTAVEQSTNSVSEVTEERKEDV